MHAAENLSRAGLQVTLVEALGQVLPGYFDAEAAGLIEKTFAGQGVKVLTGTEAGRVSQSNGRCTLELESGQGVTGDILLVATGVRPNIDFLEGTGIEVDQGVLVDGRMRSTAPDVWAAGDVAQAPGFFERSTGLNPTLPNAVAQGRIAGMDMAQDPALKPFEGRIPMNTYGFFGHRAFAVGLSMQDGDADGVEVSRVSLPENTQYQKLVFQDDRLIGASGINCELDPGVLLQLIRRRVDLQDVRQAFADDPLGAGRVLMTKIWR
jgi:phenylglyoxylate dehydrogenase epsilon subunit